MQDALSNRAALLKKSTDGGVQSTACALVCALYARETVVLEKAVKLAKDVMDNKCKLV
jgi:hypothetical protein